MIGDKALIPLDQFWGIRISSDATELSSIKYANTSLPYISGGDNCAIYEGTVSNKGVVRFVLEDISRDGSIVTVDLTIYENGEISTSKISLESL